MTLVDSNVLLDLLTDDPNWASWSLEQLGAGARRGRLYVNPIVYAEISGQFGSQNALDTFLDEARLTLKAFSRAVLFSAGAARRSYVANGGRKERLLPDFLIGAHAASEGWTLLTRDARAYRTYFPDVRLVTP